MVDTVRTLAALQALLADNTSGDISPQDVRDFLVSVFPPQFSGARVFNSVALTGLGSGTQLTFDSETFDTDDYHDAGTPSRLTVPADGLYIVGGSFRFDAADGGTQRTIFIHLDSTDNVAVASMEIGASGVNPHAIVSLTAGQFVEARFTHDAGTADVTRIADSSPEFWIARLGQSPV